MKFILSIGFSFFFILHSFSQYNDTIPNVDTICVPFKAELWEVDSFQVQFTNDSIYLSGILTANCEGNPQLVRFFLQSYIRLVAMDNGFANCMCNYHFATSFLDNGEPVYFIEIGYKTLSPWDHIIQMYFDTLVTRTIISTIDMNGNYSGETLIYPNPFSDHIKIVFDKEKSIQKVYLRNILFQEIMKFENPGKSEVYVTTENLLPGIYFIDIHSVTGNQILKIIKK